MTESEIRTKIAKWEAAAEAVSQNKTYSVDGLTVTKQDLASIQAEIERLNSRLLALLTRRGGSFAHRRVRFIDG